ncbi:hypothetical protein GBA52_018889 [Prunus armeniaca]|nr:hypothetical protein GBA52_018889 [Prunus armeniaca]
MTLKPPKTGHPSHPLMLTEHSKNAMTYLKFRNTASCIQAQSCPDSGTQPQTSVSNERRRLGLRLLPWLRFCPRWHAVASWTWDAQDETCGICRMAFDGCCPDCKLPGDVCPLNFSGTLPHVSQGVAIQRMR